MSLFFFRILQDEFRLVRAQLTVPVKYVRNLAYKYIVYKNDMRSKEEKRCIWECLVHLPEFRNRCLVIPANKLKAGGKLKFCPVIIPYCYLFSWDLIFAIFVIAKKSRN